MKSFILFLGIKEFKESELSINKRLVKRLDKTEMIWNKDEIKKRHTSLCDLAYDEIFNIKSFRF